MSNQLVLPFLTVEDAGTLHAAAVAIDRAVGSAVAARRMWEAAELARVGAELLDILERNATAARADHPTHHPAHQARQRPNGVADQVHPEQLRHAEPTQ
jgi:hypothetical protein